MTTALFSHSDSLRHETPAGHPEQVARLIAIHAALSAPKFDSLTRLDAPLVDLDHLRYVHSETYIAQLQAASPKEGMISLDADTHMSPGSLQAAYRAAGAAVAAVDLVLHGSVHNAFCALRPPGHHAEQSKAMGFCLFGNVAVAARHALDAHGLSRVAVIDFDVHHGNGTQDLLWNEPRVMFASSQQMPLFPGSGAPDEVGAHGQILNTPLPSGSSGQRMRAAYEGDILPAVLEFAPELILVSAGFDAHRADPLAGLAWDEEDFAWLTHRICDVADEICHGRVVSTLEGGYDLQALAASVAVHVEVLMERGS